MRRTIAATIAELLCHCLKLRPVRDSQLVARLENIREQLGSALHHRLRLKGLIVVISCSPAALALQQICDILRRHVVAVVVEKLLPLLV